MFHRYLPTCEDSIPSVCPSVSLFVCLSVCRQNAKEAIFSKTKQFRAMVPIDDVQEVAHGHGQSKTVKRQSEQQKWPLVYQSSHVYTESAEYTKSASKLASPSASAEYTKPLLEVAHGLFKEPITGPLKSKMAEIHHLGSWRQDAKTRFSQTKRFRAMVSIDDL